MIKPSSNAPSPMQPWVRSTDKQINDLQNAIARLESIIANPSQVNHEQNNALSQTFNFIEQSDGTIVTNASDMNFTGSVNAESDFAINGELSVGNPSRIIIDQNTGQQIGTQPNVQIISGDFGVNPVTQQDYFDAGEMNIFDTTLNVDAYGQITGDGLSISLTNDGQVERQNIAILGASGDGTSATFQIENNASNVAVYTPGRYVTITGIDPIEYNTNKSLITSVNIGVSPMTFTIDGTATATYVAGGYVTINQANSIYESKLSVQGPGPIYNGTTVNQNGIYIGQNSGDPSSATSYINQNEISTPSAVISGTRVFVSNTAPTAISDGDLWVDSSGKIPLTPTDIPVNYSPRNVIINSCFDVWQRTTVATSITGATAGSTTTYTAVNSFVVGQYVQVNGMTPTTLNSSGRITAASGTSFTVDAVTTGTFSSGGAAIGSNLSISTTASYAADRWKVEFDGTGATRLISQQVFATGTSPIPGIDNKFFYRYNQTVAGTGGTYNNILVQPIEGVGNYNGQTVTVSFWAKADSARTITPIFTQYFGSGGSPSSPVYIGVTGKSITTSWARYDFQITLPSISGKIIGSNGNDSLILTLQSSTLNATQTIDIVGVQVEAGSSVGQFVRNSSSVAGEITACQRYYIRFSGNGSAIASPALAPAFSDVALGWKCPMVYPVKMRTIPTLDASGLSTFRVRRLASSSNTGVTALSLSGDTTADSALLLVTTVAGAAGESGWFSGLTHGCYLGFNAEL